MSPDRRTMNEITTSAGDTPPADWARPLVDAAAFAAEQARLAHVWTFLGITADLARDGDWMTASLATRSVFVQRFGRELRGFENLCVHRFYPLRTARRGNGPVVCGFHHWRYDAEGRALGIPLSEEAFGAVSRALDARLTPIEIAVCGTLVFGRFPAPHATQSLEEFLGEGYSVLAALSQMPARPLGFTRSIEANWRLSLHISLDDYHAVAVHPDSFGRGGYVHRADITYARFGPHNAFLNSTKGFAAFAAACRDGTARSTCYTILQVMPNLLLAQARTDGNRFYCALHHYVPVSHDRTLLQMWTYPTPLAINETWLGRLYRWTTDPVRRYIVRDRVARIMDQDKAVCERLQRSVSAVDRSPRLGALEERIAWFEESYRQLMVPPQEPTPTPSP